MNKQEDVDGEEMIKTIEDNEEFERIGQIFLNRIAKEFEEEDEAEKSEE